jgi:hypothetical protein
MNALKKYLGICWMLLAPALIGMMSWQAVVRIAAADEGVARTNAILQWGIILFIFIPICAGLFIFGRYAWRDEYRHLPQSSAEIGED